MSGLPRRAFLLDCCAICIAARAVPGVSAEDFGRIFVYAQRMTPMRSPLNVSCNGTAAATIKKGSFFALTLAAGRYTIGTESGVPVTVEVRTGEDTFVRINWSQHVNRSPIPVVSVVPADRARQEMRYLSYIKAGDVRSESVEKSDPRTPEEPALKRR